MTVHRDRLQCPLCAGTGEVRSSRLAEFFTDPQLKAKIQSYIASAAAAAEDTAELVAVSEPQRRDFQKEVHTWNPTLPLWRRSPKE